jgi:hypothetical protein
MRRTWLVCAGASLLCGPAGAADLGDWSVAPYETTIGDDLLLKLHGQADGSAYVSDQPSFPGLDDGGVTGAAQVAASLERDYDSGLVLALKSVFEVYHDRLSGDNYGSDFVQKVYGQVQTGLGRVEIGNTDGAVYTRAVTGPVANGFSSIDNPNVTFFRDPATGRSFADQFALNSAVETSLNYAKVSYYTPRLFGVQLGASFTPSEGKDVVPFVNKGPHVGDRQTNIWEVAASYSDYFGPLQVQFSGGWSAGHDDLKTAGHAGLTDWSLGTELDYALDDDWKLAVGGAYRKSNAYRFDVNSVFDSGESNSTHVSATLTHGSWILGGEIGDGTAEGSASDPTLGLHAASATIGYVLNSNLQLNLGWEQFAYHRDIGTFYNGSDRIKMNAGFLTFEFKV